MGPVKDWFSGLPPFVVVWWCFAIVVSANQIHGFAHAFPAPVEYVLIVIGSGGCAWLWLLSRSLFRSKNAAGRSVACVVGVIVFVEASSALHGLTTSSADRGEVFRVLNNAASLVCLSMLALVLGEALSGLSGIKDSEERRFRFLFVAGYFVLMGVAMVWAINAEEGTLAGHWQDAALTSTGFASIILTRMAVAFRKRHPIADSARHAQRQFSANGDPMLADRILERVAEEKVLTMPTLKVSDFADLLGEHDYKITQCITGPLGYRNFNHFINTHRIERAKSVLADPETRNRPILSIAYDCGFNSIGPFNRAFKADVGMTPSAFRAAKYG